jgi:hypothetical protein
MLADVARKLRLLESGAAWLSNDFVWKPPIALETQACGESGARFELKPGKVVVCYELIAEFIEL